MICEKCLDEIISFTSIPTRLIVEDAELQLTPVEGIIFELLLEDPGSVISWSRIYSRVYDIPREGLTVRKTTNRFNSMKVLVCRLRASLLKFDQGVFILTVWNRGLRLESAKTVRLAQ